MAHKCEARQYSDVMECHRCKLQWDTNDPDRPDCKSGRDMYKQQRGVLAWLVKKLKS